LYQRSSSAGRGGIACGRIVSTSSPHSGPTWLRSWLLRGEWCDDEGAGRAGSTNHPGRGRVPRLRHRSARHTRAAQVFTAPEVVDHHHGRRSPPLPQVRPPSSTENRDRLLPVLRPRSETGGTVGERVRPQRVTLQFETGGAGGGRGRKRGVARHGATCRVAHQRQSLEQLARPPLIAAKTARTVGVACSSRARAARTRLPPRRRNRRRSATRGDAGAGKAVPDRGAELLGGAVRVARAAVGEATVVDVDAGGG
jgi:hypothetical protein